MTDPTVATQPAQPVQPRLRPLRRDELAVEHVELFDQIAATRGGMPTSFRVFLNSPAAAAAIAEFGSQVRFRGALPARVLEIVVMRAAAVLGDRFMWAHHETLARDAGLSADELAALRNTAGPLAGQTQADAELVAFVDAMLAGAMTDDVFDAIRSRLGDGQIMDLCLAVAYYGMQHTLFTTLRLDSDHDTRDLQDLSPGRTAP